MKRHLLCLCLSLVLGASIARADKPDPDWRAKAEKVVGKKSELEKLVKADSTQAAAWIAQLAEEEAKEEDEPRKALLEALSTAWSAAQESDFPERMKAYFAGLDESAWRIRADLLKRHAAMRDEFLSNLERRDATVFQKIIPELDTLAAAFDQEADSYMASECYLILADCVDERLRETRADTAQALKWWEKAVELRETAGVKDKRHEDAATRVKKLKERGADKAPDPGAGEAQPVPVEGAAATTIKTTFELLSSPEQFLRPCYEADDLYPMWLSMSLQKKGSAFTFPNMDEPPTVVRVGSSDVRVDVEGDGKGDGEKDLRVPLTGNIAQLKLEIGKGSNARPWGVLYVTGVQKDSYQGIEMNLQADDNQMAVYYLGASSVVGDLAGTKIRVIDDSVDGVYGTVPKTFGNIGMSRDHYQPNMDSIVVGDAKRARPWSELQQIGGKWWSFDMQSDGRELSARQVAVDTGVLKLEYKGGVAPTWCVLKGEGQLQNCFFDIVEGGSKGVEVPTGRYTLYYGEVRKGKKRQQQKALIVPSKGMQNWDVRKGETTVVQLGAPFDFDFRTRLEEGVLTIEGASVVATGSAGERYERAWQCVPQVEAAWRKSGTKKASKAEKLPRVLDNDGINTLGWAAAWFPLDLQMEAKGVEKVEVQLVDKKHDLFGKVESAWKE
jgi:hypothetical protein